MVFYKGLYFTLQSGKEHCQLRLYPCQIEIIEKEGEISYLQYTEDTSKNRPGGLKGRKVIPKVVIHHANTTSHATHLYQSVVDEQLAMERTGHRSIDGIRSFKRTADFQHENVSDIILNCNASKQVGTVLMPLHMASKHAGIESPNTTKNLVPGTYNFHSCASVTFNIQYGPTCTSSAQEYQ